MDIVTVLNLPKHLISTETMQQISAGFAYAGMAMDSIKNLPLLGSGKAYRVLSMRLVFDVR